VFHVGDVIRKLRQGRGWNVENLAQQAGIDKMTVSRIERGEGARQESLDKIARAFGLISAVELYRLVPTAAAAVAGVEPLAHEGERTGEDIFTDYRRDDIPVIVEGHATPQPGLFWSEDGSLRSDVVDERVSRPSGISDPHAYAIRVHGDSMFPRFKPGERLIASPRQEVRDGDEVYVELLSGERLIKQARRTSGGWMLVSYNPAYPPREVRREEVGAIHPIIHITAGRVGRRVVAIRTPRTETETRRSRNVDEDPSDE
jgi:phage repressor protein C with HTH and peptisase S24 domain